MGTPNIAILGAGPSGLTLARLLYQNKISVVVFESEASAHGRQQGGTLDLHDGTGLDAIKKADLWEEFQKFARYDGEALILADKNFKKYAEQPRSTEETGHGRPEIDRSRLREILLNSLPEDVVQWGHHVESVTDDLTIHFSDGSTASGFDLIVGADGASSKARPVVTDVQPEYSGISGLDLTLSNAAERAPALEAIVNHGSMFSFSDAKGIMAQHTGAGDLRVYAFAREPAGWPRPGSGGRSGGGFDIHDPAAVRQGLERYYADWAPELRGFLSAFDDDRIRQWSLYQLPVDHTWMHRPGVTLIGDAAHLMTVFAGEGVNQSMADSLELAAQIEAVVQDGGKLDAAVQRYEEGMFPRAHAVMKETNNNKEAFYNPAPAEEWMPKVVEMMGGAA